MKPKDIDPVDLLFADLDTAAIALRLMSAEHPRLRLGPIADRVSAHARDVLSRRITLPQTKAVGE